MTISRVFAALAGALCCAGFAAAQDFPTRAIRFIVPNSAGGAPDAVARILAPEISKALGQPVVVENKVGAGSIIGFEYVAKQVPADGYTIISVSVPGLAAMPVTARELRFDPLKDLPPVTGIAEGRYILVSSSTLPWKTVNELIAHAKANPGKLNYGAASPLARLTTEAFIRAAGVDIVHVPYSAAAAFYQAVVSSEVHMIFTSESAVLTLGDKVRSLAATGDRRRPPFLDIPTFVELGHPQVRGLGYSVNVPAGTPKAVVDRLHAALVRAMQQPEARTRFANIQLELVSDTAPETAAKRLADEAKSFADIAKQVGLKPE